MRKIITFIVVTLAVHFLFDAGTSADDMLSESVMWIASIGIGGFVATKVSDYVYGASKDDGTLSG